MIYKRATVRLRAAGIEDIVIRGGTYGPYPYHTKALRQSATCFKSVQEAIEAVLAGYRPTIQDSQEEATP